MRFPAIRAAAGLILISAWLALLFSGWAFRGAVHLLLAAALVLFPWRAAADRLQDAEPDVTNSE